MFMSILMERAFIRVFVLQTLLGMYVMTSCSVSMIMSPAEMVMTQKITVPTLPAPLLATGSASTMAVLRSSSLVWHPTPRLLLTKSVLPLAVPPTLPLLLLTRLLLMGLTS